MLAKLEEELLDALVNQPNHEVGGPIFILGAPRTGSTIFYQSFVAAFKLPYFANLTNDNFSHFPIIGLCLQAGLPFVSATDGESNYGKTRGLQNVSEASGVMTKWFGGGHPSEQLSPGATSNEKENHFKRTIESAHQLFGRPLVIKNPWNCFRLAFLRKTLPTANFIWIRRDLAASALSDLAARYVVQADPTIWNSATPRNLRALLRQPYWEQVVENQFEFSRAIGEGLFGISRERYAEVWYEDLCSNPESVLRILRDRLDVLRSLEFTSSLIPVIAPPQPDSLLTKRDVRAVERYIGRNSIRFAPLRYENITLPVREQMG